MQVVAADVGYGQVKWVAGSQRGRFEAAWAPHTPGAESWGLGSQPDVLIIGDQGVIAGDRAAMEGAILLCSSPARFHLRRLLEPFVPRVTVLSPGEIPATVTVQSLGVVQ